MTQSMPIDILCKRSPVAHNDEVGVCNIFIRTCGRTSAKGIRLGNVIAAAIRASVDGHYSRTA